MNEAILFVCIFCGTFGLVGLVFFCVGAVFFVARKRLEATCTAYADAMVSAVERRFGSSMVSPVFRFQIGEHTVERISRWSSTNSPYYEGQRVGIYYDPQNPSRFLVEGGKRWDRLFEYIFGGIGFLFLCIAGLVAFLILNGWK